MFRITPKGHIAWRPNRQDLEALKLGDYALNPFGSFAKIVEISFRGTDINGKYYVGYYTEFGKNGSISNSIKEGEILPTVAITGEYNRIQLLDFEALPQAPDCIFPTGLRIQ